MMQPDPVHDYWEGDPTELMGFIPNSVSEALVFPQYALLASFRLTVGNKTGAKSFL